MLRNLILCRGDIRLSLQAMFMLSVVFVFSLKLNVMSFINIYGKKTYFKPFMYTIQSCEHISLKIFWFRTFYYHTSVISEQYRYSFIIYGFRQIIDIYKEKQWT